METERCVLTRVNESDYSDLKNLFQNQQTRRFLGGIRTTEEFQQIFTDMKLVREDTHHWTVRNKTAHDFLGLISLDPHHNEKNIEISYQFLPCSWGKGYAFETVRKIIDYAFGDLKLTRIVAETQSANSASRKLLEKAGMQFVGETERFNALQSLYMMDKGEQKNEKENLNVWL